jgi:hypothetical protein
MGDQVIRILQETAGAGAGPAGSHDVWNRMVVAALALVGVFVATYLLLYKLGVMGTLDLRRGRRV